jgi:arachidonate 15-lipoxygenase
MPIPSLPQNDCPDDAQARRQQLYASRQQYKLDHDYLAPLSMLFVPHGWPPTAQEDALGPLRDLPDDESVSPMYVYPRWAPAFSTLVANVARCPARGAGLASYGHLFPLLPRPRSADHWQDDGYFAYQRLNGPNPMVVKRIRRGDRLPPEFPVSDALFQQVTGRQATLAGEIDEGRIFLADYDMLAAAAGLHVFSDPSAPDRQTRRYLPAPYGLFWWDPVAGRLEVVAIQLEREPGERNPIYTPRDGADAWLTAKTFFQVADVNLHELSTHLCRTHFALEVFPVAAARQLGTQHPVSILLRPHFEAMIYNNFRGRQLLVNPGGGLPRLLALPVASALQVLARSYREWNFRALCPVHELEDRGLNGTPLEGAFYYRADALRVWEAIRGFVDQYVRVYYGSDADIAADWELQGWARELASPAEGRVAGFPDRIETVGQLVSVIAPIIFTCGPQHAAVNFPQWDYMGFTPNMPGAAYCAPWEATGVLQVLPDLPAAVDQLSTTYTLTCFRYRTLGQYAAMGPYQPAIDDPAAQPAVRSFQRALAAIHTAIEGRNGGLPRALSYPYLDPELIPNSNNI